MLEKNEMEKGIILWEFARPYLITHDADGCGGHLDRKTYRCTEHKHCPVPCRGFNCKNNEKSLVWQAIKIFSPNQMESNHARFEVICAQPELSPQCNEYAETAVAQNVQNLERHCGFTGPRWSSDYNAHYQWCIKALRESADSENRAREDALRSKCRVLPASPPPLQGWCCRDRAQRIVVSGSPEECEGYFSYDRQDVVNRCPILY